MKCPRCSEEITTLLGWQRVVQRVEIDAAGKVVVTGDGDVEPPRAYMCPLCAAIVADSKNAAIALLKKPT
jgi:hypothetical protein